MEQQEGGGGGGGRPKEEGREWIDEEENNKQNLYPRSEHSTSDVQNDTKDHLDSNTSLQANIYTLLGSFQSYSEWS
jgi:hypothetical protein